MHPGWEQKPAHLVRPLLITIILPSLIGPYVLHLRQNPLTSVIGNIYSCINLVMNTMDDYFSKIYKFLPYTPYLEGGYFRIFADSRP